MEHAERLSRGVGVGRNWRLEIWHDPSGISEAVSIQIRSKVWGEVLGMVWHPLAVTRLGESLVPWS
jgi:hypothetical protein